MARTALGLIAGAGDLPRMILAAQAQARRPVFVIAIDGQTDPETVADGVPHGWFRLGHAGAMLEALHTAGVGEIVLAGKVERPSIFSLSPDARGAAMIARIGWRALAGDDGLLRAIREELEAEGFRVLSVPEALTVDPERLTGQGIAHPGAHPGIGPLGRHGPSDEAWQDIRRGIAVLRMLSPADIGQAVVVQQGMVLAVEAIEGTDAMIERAGGLRRPGRAPVLVKLAKQGQDDRLDLPAIGPETVRRAIAAGLAGLAVDAARALLIDRAATIALADEAGLFLVGVDPASDADADPQS